MMYRSAAEILVIGYSNLQHQQHIIICQKGELKQSPDAGVGIEDYLLGDDEDDMVREVRSEFEKDGQVVNSISFDEQKLEANL